jgi:hypothetical protein
MRYETRRKMESILVSSNLNDLNKVEGIIAPQFVDHLGFRLERQDKLTGYIECPPVEKPLAQN